MGSQSIKNGEADISIVVGSALHFDPNIFVTMTDLGMLSTDGRCRHGDAAASGYVRGEGVVAIILRRQSQAEDCGDDIRAVVRGTGVNHDGRKQGITLPSPQAQATLIRSTYRNADLDPADTTYVECHGTGTKAGDPRELSAISEVFCAGRSEPLYVGSVKTNIGHLEGASGVAGVMKATLALQRRIIPPNMHFNTPNPEIGFEAKRLRIPTKSVEWQRKDKDTPLRVSINSFGYGGTNAHAILEEYSPVYNDTATPEIPCSLADMTLKRPYLLPLTSQSDKADTLVANKLSEYISSATGLTPSVLAMALSQRRTMHRYRSFAIGTDMNSLLTSINNPMPVAQWKSKLDRVPRLGFVFTGQGAQWFGMGRTLIEQCPLFLQTLEKCDRILQTLTEHRPSWTIVEELLRNNDNTKLAQTEYSQPICTALQLALVEVLASWAIKPSSVVGHSSGELAATYAAGILSFENALVAAYYRGVHMGSGAASSNSTPGAMMAVGMTESEVVAETKPYIGRIAIAAMNSPSSFTLSGDSDAIQELHDKLSERKVFARRLQVAQAFHSHHMLPLAPGYEKALAQYPGFRANRKPTALMVSSVSGRRVDPTTLGPEYFAANMTGMVKFSDALTGIVLDEDDEQNVDVLVEVGPHPALKGPSNQTIDPLKLKITYMGTLDRKQDAYETLLATAGQLFTLGYPVDIAQVNRNCFLDTSSSGLVSPITPISKLELPGYAWDQERYWGETRVIKEHRLRPFRHGILGAPVPGSLANRPRWRNYLRVAEMPWLVDHRIEDKIIFPAAGYLNMAVEAASRLTDKSIGSIKAISLADVSVKAPIVVSERDMGTEVIFELYPTVESSRTSSSVWNTFVVFSIDESGNQREHCTGKVMIELGTPEAICSEEDGQMDVSTSRSIGSEQYYHRLHSMGLQYGKSFQLLTGLIESGQGNATAPLCWRPDFFSSEGNDLCITHPAFLDASFHVVFASIEGRLEKTLKAPYVPTFFRSIKVSGLLDAWKSLEGGYQSQVSVQTVVAGPRTAKNNLQIRGLAGEMLIEIQGLELTNLGGNSTDDSRRSLFFGTQWQPMLSSFPFANYDAAAVRGIPGLVKLYTHQFPNKKILHCTSSEESLAESLAALRGANGEARTFAQLVVTPLAPATTSTFEGTLQHWGGLVSVSTLEELEGQSFDLVISPNADDSSQYVSSDGHLLARNDSGTPSGFATVIESNGVSVWAKVNDLANGYHERSLTLVMPSQCPPEVEEFAVALEAQRKNGVDRRDFLSLSSSRQSLGDDVIVLASLGDSLYFGDNITSGAEFDAVQALLTKGSRNIVWLTRGSLMDVTSPEQALILGLARSARSENPDMRLVVLDIAPTSKPASSAELAVQLLDEKIAENEIAEREGILYIPRVLANAQLNEKIPNGVGAEPSLQPLYQANRPLALRIGRPGLLETLTFSDDLEITQEPLEPDDLELEVKASAINFRDIAASLGIIDDFHLGDECAGVVLRKGANVSDEFNIGDRVVAWRPGQGAHRTVVRNPASLTWRLGDLPFSIAAAIPLILTTAKFSLVDTARLQPGETVLIHAAAGGVGQMAIQVAQSIGANIIATVGSPSKRALLISRFGLKDSQILSSRDDSFVQGVQQLTDGRGVDVALNSLAGPLLHATWQSLAPFGRFVEIGKRDIHQNSHIAMDPFRRNVSFASVDMVTVFEKNKPLGARVFQECCQMVHDGKIQPPEPITELSYAEAQKGFRMMQMGTTMGKIVLVPGPDDRVLVEPTKFSRNQLFQNDRIYLLVGGLGGLGRRLSEWLFQRGARRLAFLSRSGADRKDARETVEWLLQRNVEVSVFRGDVTNEAFVHDAIQQIGLEHLAGVFQAAMVLQDAPLEKMGYTQWQRCLDPKVRGTFNLHKATKDIALDFFVCFSSVSAILGSKGQANYAAANTYMDALCRYRRSIGLAGTTMNVGMIVGIGAVSEDAKLQATMERIGYDAVNEQELFAQIEAAVSNDGKMVSDAQGLEGHQIITGVNLRKPDYFWATEPRFKNLYANHDFSGSASGTGVQRSLMAQLNEARDEAERAEILTQGFLEKIADVLSVDKATLQPNRSLADYGLDSIVAIEIRQWVFQSVAVEIAMFDVLNSASIQALVDKIASMVILSATETQAATNQGEITNEKNAQAADIRVPSVDSMQLTTKIAADEAVAMSTFQRRLWFAHNLAEDPSVLNLPTVFHLKGEPNVRLVTNALEELKRRNDILRTAYFEGDEVSQQLVMDDCSVQVPFLDFSAAANAQERLENYVKSMRDQTLDIETGEVMKASLVTLSDTEHALVLIHHHICIDRGSSQSFLEQFTSIYDSLRRGTNLETVPQPSVSYGQFSRWHNDRLSSKEMQHSLDFWMAEFQEKPEPMKLLPFAQVAERPEYNDYKRQVHRTTLKVALLNRMKRICARLAVTPAQFLMAAFRVFLYRYGQEDVLTMHMVDGNRPHPAVNNTLGFFVNVVPLRCADEVVGVTFETALQQIKSRIVSALAHSELPFDAIVDAVGVDRNPAHFPLGQVIVNYQIHGTMPTFPAGDFDITDVKSDDIPTACELALEALEDPSKGLHLRLESSTTLYGEADVERFLDNFAAFMSSAIRDHRQPVSEMDLVGPKELDFLKQNMFNLGHTENYWNHQSVAERILEMANRQPEAVAVKWSDNDKQLTYGELVASASDVATALRRAGVSPGTRVAILSYPGPDAVRAMVGVLFSGCGYLALDPDFASNRMAFMISDSGAPVVLAGPGLEEKAKQLGAETSAKVLELNGLRASDKILQVPVPAKDDPFYVIYTSVIPVTAQEQYKLDLTVEQGSTGTPKGVVLSQSNTQQMLCTLNHDYEFDNKDRFLQQSSTSFDLSIVQIFSALTAGACVCVASHTIRKDPIALAAYMESSQVSVTYFTPTQFAVMMEHASDNLRRLTKYRVAYFAGERLPVRVAQAFYKLGTPAVIYNTWSPSELVVQTTIQRVDVPSDETTSLPIGFPMANTRHYILDDRGKPLPAGFVGEIVVGGAQVGLGYINRPEVNERAFCLDPFCSEADKQQRGWTRMFRTGDRGRFLPGGNLEFHGRIAGDKQIKFRGYRIDLGEVEHRLFIEANKDGAGPGIVDLAVVARSIERDDSDSLSDNRQLIAFVVPKQQLDQRGKANFAVRISQYGSQYLNSYMLPNAYQFLPALPVTIGGKVDRQKLLHDDLQLTYPVEDAADVADSPDDAQANGTHADPIIDAVTDGFRELLKIPKNKAIAPTHSFFALGGNSVMLVRLQARLKRTLKRPVALNPMFKAPTPYGIAQIISGKTHGSGDAKADIRWEEETKLEKELVPSTVPKVAAADVTSVLVTGADSFIGVHMIATLLQDAGISSIFVLGSQKVLEYSDVEADLTKYCLWPLLSDRENVASRVIAVPGSLAARRFGLSRPHFHRLGGRVQAIYHLGGYVSLLQSYDALKLQNVDSARDVIDLSRCGSVQAHIHHLSTWSVPHLQEWSTSKRLFPNRTITSESSSGHFVPENNNRFGYFKSRWAAEQLMEKAAQRGFPVTIYRASAATGSVVTGVAEPEVDFIRAMILSMVQSGLVPSLPTNGDDFVADFVPVDYLTDAFHALATSELAAPSSRTGAIFYHICNPSPLPISQIPSFVGEIYEQPGRAGKVLPVAEWLETVSRMDMSPDAQLRWEVLREYFDLGHNMFALDSEETRGVLAKLDVDECPPMDAAYLQRMVKSSQAD
jgi:amino acid adenylation domain-containing protein/thioester reductase-like protein